MESHPEAWRDKHEKSIFYYNKEFIYVDHASSFERTFTTTRN